MMTALALRPRLLRLLLTWLVLAFAVTSGNALAGPKPASGQFLAAGTFIVAGAADGAGDAAAEDEGAGAGASCGCFAAGTLVATPQGEVPITKIKVGDLVDSRDAQTGATAAEPVLRLIVHHHQQA